MRKIKLLDLCCKAGGCSRGYADAADALGIEIEITGVDIEPQPNYKYNFIQADAVEYLKRFGYLYTHFHASPPCQQHSRTRSLHKNIHPEFLQPLRVELIATGKPYVIENVSGCPLINPVALDGTMFGLRVIRRRLFESNIKLISPPPGKKMGSVGGRNYNRTTPGFYYIVGGHQTGTLMQWRDAMAIDWMNKKELAQAVPPPYTKFIGVQFLAA